MPDRLKTKDLFAKADELLSTKLDEPSSAIIKYYFIFHFLFPSCIVKILHRSYGYAWQTHLA